MKKIYFTLIIIFACIACTRDAEWTAEELYVEEIISVLTPSTVQITLDFAAAVKPMIESVAVSCAPEDNATNTKSFLLNKENNFTVVVTDFIPEQRYNVAYTITPSYLQQKEFVSSFVTHCNALPEVVTGIADELTPVSAKLHGSVEKGMSGYTIEEFGFYYSLLPNGEYERHQVKCGENSNGEAFSATINTLRAGATYYYYPYSTNVNGISYGDTLSFTLPRTY